METFSLGADPKPSSVSAKQLQPKTSSSSSSPVSSCLHLSLPCSRPPCSGFYMDCRVLLPFPVEHSLLLHRFKLRGRILIHMVSASNASLIIAASVAAVESLEDQAGLCRWNYAVGSLHQRAKRSMAPLSQAKKGGEGAVERVKRTERSLSKLIHWDCWGPK
ncbi:hypothetical protein BHE74_00056174 [Ensete ventricosum]|nr:hypothetical protein GW17_00059253 [Ensete ventricosum]RWW38591.1 hypothetical protein BHE74_00056174 [Ensete ventricosum]